MNPLKKSIAFGLFSIIVAAFIFGIVWRWQKISQPALSSEETKQAEGEDVPIIPNTKVQWKGKALPLGDLKLVLQYRDDFNSDLNEDLKIKYYDLGSNGDNKIILAIGPEVDVDEPAIFFFEQNKDGYHLISKMSAAFLYTKESEQGFVLSQALLSPETEIYYEGVLGPKEFAWHGLKLEGDNSLPGGLFQDYLALNSGKDDTLEKMATVDAGDLYLEKRVQPAGFSSAKFFVQSYILKLPSGFYTTYGAQYDFFTNDSVPEITWSNGVKNTDPYVLDAGLGGCGDPNAYVVFAGEISGAIKVAGENKNGEEIYELKDTNHPIMKYFYGLSSGKFYDENTSQYKDISFGEWAKFHPVVFYKNSIGDYVIFTNYKYGPGAECGKPVIYLYPTHTTNIKVQVGADITKSEPLYQNGWQVTANPDGVLKNVDGKYFDSLFWEGKGRGPYPAITEGIIVPKEAVEKTLRENLSELGLSTKESEDFLEFWLPKMPKTPFVRFTWFTTQELDQLAPLVVLPRPDTMLRVFLDFEGLEKPVSLPKQKLNTTLRKGFTLVEWGGILRK